jgi:hypothetical protein
MMKYMALFVGRAGFDLDILVVRVGFDLDILVITQRF